MLVAGSKFPSHAKTPNSDYASQCVIGSAPQAYELHNAADVDHAFLKKGVTFESRVYFY